MYQKLVTYFKCIVVPRSYLLLLQKGKATNKTKLSLYIVNGQIKERKIKQQRNTQFLCKSDQALLFKLVVS